MTAGKLVYSPEFDLVLACLRWPQETVDGDRIQSIARQPIRWPYLQEILQHHKVAPLFLRNLEAFAPGCMPEEAAVALRAAGAANDETCARRTSQVLQLNRLFREQQIDHRIFKGIPLAITAYRDPALRDAGDIDLLVAERDLFTAGEILRAQGYVRLDPQARLTRRRLRSYLAHQKDFSYGHPLSDVMIDLHWRLFRHAYLPANAGLIDVGEEWVEIGSERIATLPSPRLLLYLCVHGALDGWLRLKWLTDIGALVHAMTPEQLASTVNMARDQQALPQLNAAILLCEELLGQDLRSSAEALSEALDRNDKAVAHILRFSKQLVTSNQFRPIREEIPSTQWFLNEFRLYDSPRYRLDLILRSLFRPRVWRWLNLPDQLFPLYALISPFEFLNFHFRNRWQTFRQTHFARPVAPHQPRMRLSFRRIKRLAPADIALAAEAACMLTFFRAALNFLPTQRLTRWMDRYDRKRPSISPAMARETIGRVQWSIEAVTRHAPLTFVCFPRSLAAYFMLRRRHIVSKLFYGVAR
ncbi:MAG: lasso peptide biosynthesis B2 protein, partial [Bryobacteraceae bacterium]